MTSRVAGGGSSALAFACLLVLVGCRGESAERGGAGGGAADERTATDVTSADRSGRPEVARWAVDPEPALTIGGEGADSVELYGVRGLVRLTDGRIVIADHPPRILVVDPDGRLLESFGRPGEGPGEFGLIDRMQRLPGDTLLVADWSNGRRVSYLTADGGLVRSVTPLSAPPPRFVGALADGSLVGVAPHRLPRPNTGSDVAWVRAEAVLLRYDPDGTAPDSLGMVPDREALIIPGLGSFMPGFPLLETFVVPADRRIYVATGERSEVRVLSPEGEELGVIRGDHNPHPLVEDDLIALFGPGGALAGAAAPDRVRTVDWNVPNDRTLPAVTAVLVDRAGRVWVEEGSRDREVPATWFVFDPSGEPIAKVTMPARFEPFDIGDDRVLGVSKDELDVERVQLLEIVR